MLLPPYLSALGLGATQIGVILFGTLFGSALVTLWAGLAGQRIGRRRLLLGACAPMMATGLGFIYLRSFWSLFAVAFVGTLNPSAGDVSVFLPLEQATLAETVVTRDLTGIFAIYNVAGPVAGARRSRKRSALSPGFPIRLEYHRRSTFRLRRLLCHRADCSDRLQLALWRGRSGCKPGAYRSACKVAQNSRAPGDALQPGRVRWRPRHSVAAGALALPSLQHVCPGQGNSSAPMIMIL